MLFTIKEPLGIVVFVCAKVVAQMKYSKKEKITFLTEGNGKLVFIRIGRFLNF